VPEIFPRANNPAEQAGIRVSSCRVIQYDESVEMAHRANKTHMLMRTLGVLPGIPHDHLAHLTSALEIACGPGDWTREMGRVYPQMQVIGIDTSARMIAHARTMQQRYMSTNIDYLLVPELVGPFPFADASFDLVSMHNMSLFLLKENWAVLLAECKRILRPAGLIRITDGEPGFSNAPTHEEFNQLFLHAMCLDGRSFSPSDRHLGILYELEPLLFAAGFQVCSDTAHMINYSYGAPSHEEWKKACLIFAHLVKPFIVHRGLRTEEHIEMLLQQMSYEMSLPTFHAIIPLLTLWGTKRDEPSAT